MRTPDRGSTQKRRERFWTELALAPKGRGPGMGWVAAQPVGQTGRAANGLPRRGERSESIPPHRHIWYKINRLQCKVGFVLYKMLHKEARVNELLLSLNFLFLLWFSWWKVCFWTFGFYREVAVDSIKIAPLPYLKRFRKVCISISR